MKKADRKALLTYLRHVGNEVSLRDWTFVLSREDAEEGCTASCNPWEGRKGATIRVRASFRDLSGSDQRHAITHELIHCHHAAASDIIRQDLLKHMSQEAYDVLWAGFIRQMEYMVDGLADAFAPHMPLIEWPK